MMYQYAVYTGSSKFLEVCDWLIANAVRFEPHLNRTRFWLEEGPQLTEFLLRYSQDCQPVETEHAVFRL